MRIRVESVKLIHMRCKPVASLRKVRAVDAQAPSVYDACIHNEVEHGK